MRANHVIEDGVRGYLFNKEIWVAFVPKDKKEKFAVLHIYKCMVITIVPFSKFQSL